MKWSDENTLEFLRFYKQHPAVWNHANPYYKNRLVVADAWMKIKNALSFECTLDQLKNKKDSLMSTFKNILRRMKIGGIANAEVCDYNTGWFAYKTMAEFLLDTANQTKPTNETRKFVYELNNDNSESESSISENSDIDTSDWYDNIEEESQIASKRPHEADNSSRKRKKTSFIEKTQPRNDETHSLESKINEQNVQEKDECSLYLDLLGTKLRSLDENTRDKLMRDIDHLYFCAKYISPLTNTNHPMSQ